MTRAFLFITTRSLWNRVAKRLKRLREPRYAAGLVIGFVYLYWAILRNQWRAGRGGGLFAEPGFVEILPTLVVVGGLLLWAFVVLAWLWPSPANPIQFSGPEVQFLYTAPVSRRQLINYKLLRSQMGILFGVFIAMLFSGGLAAAARGRVGFMFGGWLLFSTLRLHLIVIGLTKSAFRRGAGAPPWRAWIPVAVTAALSVSIVWTAAHAIARWRTAPGDFSETFNLLGRSGIGGAALWPFRAMVAPIFAPTWSAFLMAAAPAVGLLLLNYVWVLRSDALQGDVAIAAEKKASSGSRALPAPTARVAPFALSPSGRPEFAILWKNLILLGRYASPRMVIRFLLPIVALAVAFGASLKGQAAASLAPLALMVTGFFIMMGHLMMRNDLRHDMPRLAVLKTWPVSGATLVVGELLAPLVTLTVLAWTGIAISLALSGTLRWQGFGWWERGALAAAAAFVAPTLIAAQLLIQNAAVVLFPGWIPTGGRRPKGIEAMGQQMLMLAGTAITLLLGLIPSAAIAGLAGFLLWMVIGPFAVLPAAVLFAGVLAGEFSGAVLLLGRLLERTDPTQVEAED